jgi:hypothetical protein
MYLIRDRQLATVCNPNHFLRAIISYYRTAKKQQTARQQRK